MDLTQDDVLQILKLLEESSFDYLEVEIGDLKLVANKNGAGTSRHAVSATSTSADLPTAGPSPAVQSAAPSAPVGAEAAAEEQSTTEGLLTVTAPMVGTFYAASEPGAPPFVKLGSRVDEDTTMGLIEVMKVFNSIRSGVRGEVVRILAENAQLVEFGQPLFLVKPE